MWLAYVGVWTVLGLLQAAARIVEPSNDSVAAVVSIARGILDLYSWGATALLIFWIAQKLPIRQGRWKRHLLLHVAVGIGVIFARLFTANALAYLFGIGDFASLLAYFRVLPISLPMYFALLGVGHAYRFWRELRERELAAVRLRSELSAAQLQVLRMQMQPHFLFNTLNSIVSLIHTDSDGAERMVVSLSEMLRRSMTPDGAPEISVREELHFLAPYLDIEQTRLRDRLTVRTEIDPEVLDAKLPQLSLQPLVENAVRHGIAARSGRGTITISARRVGDMLKVVVHDDGVGSSEYIRNGGIGLANLRERLRQLYGESGTLQVVGVPNQGTAVELSVPCGVQAPGADKSVPGQQVVERSAFVSVAGRHI